MKNDVELTCLLEAILEDVGDMQEELYSFFNYFERELAGIKMEILLKLEETEKSN